jgi:hypothetical protein
VAGATKKAPLPTAWRSGGAFFAFVRQPAVLLAFASLMPRAGQQLAMLVFAHLLSTLLDDTAQQITSRFPMYAGPMPKPRANGQPFCVIGSVSTFLFGLSTPNLIPIGP